MLKLIELSDCRTMGQIFDDCPLAVHIECISKDGIEYKGWYYTEGWENKDSKGFKFATKQYHFYQSKLKDGKKCIRKVSAKITEKIIDLIKSHISSVEDHKEYFKKITTRKIGG